jgi:hypothetical protein
MTGICARVATDQGDGWRKSVGRSFGDGAGQVPRRDFQTSRAHLSMQQLATQCFNPHTSIPYVRKTWPGSQASHTTASQIHTPFCRKPPVLIHHVIDYGGRDVDTKGAHTYSCGSDNRG